MADRLNGSQIEQLTGPDVRAHVRHSLTIDGVDYSERIIKAGKVKWTLCNRHPKRQGSLVINTQSLILDNRDGRLTVGNTAGPWATEQDRLDSKCVARTKICSPALTVHDFTGAVRSLTQQSDGTLVLEIEHPLKMAHDRVWKREDKTSDFETSTTITRDATP